MPSPPRPMANEILLVHTNDTHGRLRPPVSDRLRILLGELPEALYLDAGDTVSAGNLGFKVGGEPVLEEMSALGCRAMCLGNRETHPRKEIFPIKVGKARHPLLCANAVAKGDAPLPVVPHLLLEHHGVRLGLFGVTVPMFTRKQWSQALCDYWFDDPLVAAKREAEALRPHVDLLIALTHIGYRQDLLLAEACPGVDLVIGGHSHTDLSEPTWVGQVPVVQARSHGYFAGIARMGHAENGWKLRAWEKRPLRDDAPVDASRPSS